jgi:hypothetical protein
MKRAREGGYLRGAQEAKIVWPATRGVFERQQMFEWAETFIEDGRAKLEAQHALDR